MNKITNIEYRLKYFKYLVTDNLYIFEKYVAMQNNIHINNKIFVCNKNK